MGDRIRFNRLRLRHKNDLSIRTFIEDLRASSFTQEEAYLQIASLAERDGFEYILGLQEDVIDEVYREVWRIRSKRMMKGSHTQQEWEEKQEQYGGRCLYCGAKNRKLSKDHVIPISQGGDDTINNIVPACKSCNSKKHAKPLEVFFEGVTLKLL